VRLDQALLIDIRSASGSRAIRAFLVLELLAGGTFILRRGSDTASSVALVWMAMLVLAFLAWWAGRHRLAQPWPDQVPAAGPRAFFALLAATGMLAWGAGVGPAAGFLLFACGTTGWLWAALRTGSWHGVATRLGRDPRPFLPLLLLVAVPKLLIVGPAFLVAAVVALPSGVGQQLLYLVGLFAPLEALRGRTADAAVVAALVFGLLHVPFVMEENHGDLVASVANVVILQASVGLIACLAFVRHRAVLPIGVAHALAIA